MTSGPEHFRRAEHALQMSHHPDGNAGDRAAWLACAGVHAQLANIAALVGVDVDVHRGDWREALGEDAPREPAGPGRCELPAGGVHGRPCQLAIGHATSMMCPGRCSRHPAERNGTCPVCAAEIDALYGPPGARAMTSAEPMTGPLPSLARPYTADLAPLETP